MSWITIAWSMAASACLTLAILHLLIWCRQPDQWGSSPVLHNRDLHGGDGGGGTDVLQLCSRAEGWGRKSGI
ncbi:MAG: hypothetical protein JO232_03505 [Verrucomicrobia bacterium]|nr:hypothetical protein [Verrucomicrobiota bacterium]